MKKLNLFSIPIVLFVSFLAGNVSARLFDTTLRYKNNNLEKIVYYTKQCPQMALASQNDKRVILRIDDVQANTWRNTSKQMVLDTKRQNMQTVLGVIPKDLESDSELFGFLRKNSCHFELALHGWEHRVNGNYDEPEFGKISQQEAEEKIKLGLKNLKKLTREKITTFIPPQNAVSRGAVSALKKSGFKTVSSEGKGKYDYTVSAYDWKNDKLIPAKEVINDCQQKFSKNQTCVIMLHPQDFSTGDELDPKKYQEYSNLLKQLNEQDITTVTFAQFQ